MTLAADTTPIIGHRLARGAMYFSIAAAGVALFFIPIPFMQNIIGMTYAMIALFLLIGGVTSSVGHWMRIIVVERAGYPLILAALVCLTGTLFNESDQQASRLFIGFLVFAFTLGLYGRWRDLGVLRRVQVKQAHEEAEANGGG